MNKMDRKSFLEVALVFLTGLFASQLPELFKSKSQTKAVFPKEAKYYKESKNLAG
jgi:hypothetical protein